MCGIHVTVSRHSHVDPDEHTIDLLRHRGPDHLQTLKFTVNSSDATNRPQIFVTLTSSVLSLRGDHLVEQPITFGSTSNGQALCWNGEAWSFAGCPITGNDGDAVFRALTHITTSFASNVVQSMSHEHAVAQVLASFAGPHAFVYLDHRNARLYFGRDFLGRRSLLRRECGNGDLQLCSVSTRSSESGSRWEEVEADGIYWVQLDKNTLEGRNGKFFVDRTDYYHNPDGRHAPSPLQLRPSDEGDSGLIRPSLTPESPSVAELERHLRNALRSRLQLPPNNVKGAASIAILFSGGLDCTVLARLAHEILPHDMPIDLLNVAFENPRAHKDLGPNDQPYELCPDRKTGRQSHSELECRCPGRQWRFVAINIPYTETRAHRDTILSLLSPHNTEMDLSIGCALYFASRGVGQIAASTEDNSTNEYRTPARILLSGLGADELFAGYSRHAIAFARKGHAGLRDELELDVSRLGKRNLGRDDRVISHWAREARFPFLDETLVRWALQAAVGDKCGFGIEATRGQEQDGHSMPLLEPGKLVLRCLAWRLGMHHTAREKKRAIQFGARTAKMEAGRTKGTHAVTLSNKLDVG